MAAATDWLNLRRRRETAAQIVHEQGITYTVYGDTIGAERPWQLDPIPLVISPEPSKVAQS